MQASAERAGPYALEGQVVWPDAGRESQSTIGDVASGATVSLIDVCADPDYTVITTLTKPDGRFSLTFPLTFVPGSCAYVVEAVKGLKDNAVGENAARVRTFAQWSGRWTTTSCDKVVISSNTTGLAVIAGLRGLRTENFLCALDYTVKVNPPKYNGVTAVTESEYLGVVDMVRTAIAADNDPVAVIKLDSRGQYELRLTGTPIIAAVDPDTATPGTLVHIRGEAFDKVATDNTVAFVPKNPDGTLDEGGAVAGTIESGTTNDIYVRVPNGAKSGIIRLKNKSGLGDTADFTVLPIFGGNMRLY